MKADRSRLAAKLARAESAWIRLEEFIDNIQQVRRHLTDQVEKILETFVRTKDAFEDLFRRIARNPAICAGADGERPQLGVRGSLPQSPVEDFRDREEVGLSLRT
jgi:hypothetical protein